MKEPKGSFVVYIAKGGKQVMKIGVIAGTPVDTRMGGDFVRKNGHFAIERASSKSAEEQLVMQNLHATELTEQVLSLCKEMIGEGADGIMIYCNSMTAAIDVEYVRNGIENYKLVTPFDIYRENAKKYKSTAIIAANGQSLAAIEKIIIEENEKNIPYGASLMPLVVEIEKKTNPHEIVKKLKLDSMIDSFKALGADALILGCTHFPYVLDSLKKITDIPLIEPSYEMLNKLQM